MRTFGKILGWIIFALCILISLYFLFNGGIQEFGAIIKEDGFFEFVKQFFVGIWNGIKNTFA